MGGMYIGTCLAKSLSVESSVENLSVQKHSSNSEILAGQGREAFAAFK